MFKKTLAATYRAMEFVNRNPVLSQLMAESLDDLIICVYSIADNIVHWFVAIVLST